MTNDKRQSLQKLDSTQTHPRRKLARRKKRHRSSPKSPKERSSQASKPNSSENHNFRLLLVWLVIVFGVTSLGLNLYRLQILDAAKLSAKARNQQMVYLRPYVPRRPILDTKGNVLATDRLVYSLFAHPKLFKVPPEEIATKLSGILPEKSASDLLEKFGRRETGLRLAYSLNEGIADQITALGIDGLELIRQYSRFYPHQEMAAEVVGYANLEHQGQAGIEYTQENLLERSVLTVQLNRAGNGALMPSHLPEGFLNFDKLELQLTVDLRLQRAARLALKQQMSKYDAKRGAVIVMDVHDGSLLAMVCEPTYNPNRYYDYDVALFKNWAVSDLYEPGSTFKPINVAIALEAGVIEPNSTFYDSGSIKIEHWDIRNYDYSTRGARGRQNVTQILQYSSNVGMVKIVERLSASAFYDALERLGIKKSLGVDLAGETPGQLKSKNAFTATPVEAATASFGQGFSLTPLKLAQLHAAIANGGILVRPHVVKSLVDPEGKVHWQPELPTSNVFSPSTTQTVLEMMEKVVAKGNVRKYAAIDNYRVAGKTGTAQKASPNGGYYDGIKITSFVGILPVEDPQYVVLAVVDEPKGKKQVFGSTVAAPIVKSVMEAVIAIENLPPGN